MAFRDNFNRKNIVLPLVVFCLAVIIGALVGVGIYSAAGCKRKSSVEAAVKSPQHDQAARFESHAKILDDMKAANIKNQLR